MNEFILLDFETTGLSPDYARVIEVAAIAIKGNKIIGQLSQLMYPGCSIPYFITNITGITNQMVKGQPTPEQFMPILKKFIGTKPILAHNAAFDKKFLISEMNNVDHIIDNEFLCTLKLARRLILEAPNYKLTTLTSYLKLKTSTNHHAHRALYDVMVTYQLWLHIKELIANRINIQPDLKILQAIEQQPKNKLSKFFEQYSFS